MLLCALPLLWPAVPPLLDLPGHMGRYHVALNLASSPDLQRYYDFHWSLIGNLGVDLLVIPLASILGVESATKAVVIAIPMMMAMGFLWTAAQVHGRVPPTALLALVFTYAYPFHYGFVNYCLAMAFASLAFALWIRLAASHLHTRVVVFAVVAAAIWTAHAVGWVLFCVLCGTYELWRQHGLHRGFRWRTFAATASAVLPLATPVLLMAIVGRSTPTEFAGWLDYRTIAKSLLTLNRDRWIAYDIACTLILATVVGLALFRRAGLSINPALGWPALAFLALFLSAPDSINGSAFVGARIVPWAAAYALLAIDAKGASVATRRRWASFSASFFSLRIAATAASLFIYSQMHERVAQALTSVPRGSAVAVLAWNGCQSTFRSWANARVQHLGGLAIVRRDAFVNDQWDARALQLLTVNYAEAKPFTSSPSELVSFERCEFGFPAFLPDQIDRLPRDAFDFVWLLDVPAEHRPSRPWLSPIHSTPESVLYAVAQPAPGS